MRDAIFNMELLVAPRARFAMLDSRQYHDKVFGIDRSLLLLKRKLLTGLLTSAGVLKKGDFIRDATFDNRDLKKFVALLSKCRGQVEQAFDLVIRRDAERNPVRQLSEILRLIGLRMKLHSTSEQGGKKNRRYELDIERLDIVFSLANHRSTSWFRYEQRHLQDELNANSHQWAHEQDEIAEAA